MDILEMQTGEFIELNGFTVADKKAREKINEVIPIIDNSNEIATRLDNDCYLLIGDSYGVRSAERSPQWAESFVSFMGLNVAYAGHATTQQTNCIDLCMGGRGFIGVDSYGNWLDYVTQNFPADFDKNKITKIIIVGGYNDQNAASQTAIENAMLSFNEYIVANFPNAKVYLFCVGQDVLNSGVMGKMSMVYHAYQKANEIPNWVYCYGLETFLRRKTLMADDGHHPTSAGGTYLARGIVQAVNGQPITKPSAKVVPTWNDGVSTNRVSHIITAPDGIYTTLYINNPSTITLTEALPKGGDRVIGTLSDTYYFDYGGAWDVISYISKLVNTSGEEMIGTIWLKINADGQITVRSVDYGNIISFMLPARILFRQETFLP